MATFTQLILSPDRVIYLANLAAVVTLTGAAGLLVARACRRYSTPLRHGILTCVMALILLCPVSVWLGQQKGLALIQVAVSPGRTTGQADSASAPAPPPASPSDSGVLSSRPGGERQGQATTSPSQSSAVDSSQQAVTNTARVRDASFDAGAAGQLVSPLPDASRGPLWWQVLGTAVACAWAAGVLVGILRLSLGYILLMRIRSSLRTPDPRTAQLARRVAEGVSLRQAPPICISPLVPVPLSLGLARCAIVLPADLAARMEEAQLEAILVHEMAHIIRRDPWVGLAQRMALVIFWWNPLVRKVSNQISTLREDLCDNYVVRVQGGGEHFARTLVDVASHVTVHPRLPATVGVLEPDLDGLTERVHRLLGKERDMTTRMSFSSIVVVLMCGLFVLLGTGLIRCLQAAEVTTTRGQTTLPTQTADKPPALGERPEQPRYTARTFNSKATFYVEVKETVDGDWKSIGQTPSAVPLEIPACLSWRVWLPDSVKDWDLLLAEMRQNNIPGLRLGRDTTDADLRHLAGLTGLEFLDVSWLPITDAGLEQLKALTRLQQLNLNNTRITDAGLEYLKDLARLRALDVSGTKLTGKGLVYVKGLSRLQELNAADTQITDAGLEHLKDLTGLQRLNLNNTQVTDTGLGHLKNLTKLQSLVLSNTQITDMGLAHLRDLIELRSLDLEGTKVTDAGLGHLKGLTELQNLDLSNTKITEAGLVHLRSLTRLQELWLSGIQLTDVSLENLEGLGELKHLDLRGTQITDAGLAHLQGLSKLELLYLSSPQITDAGWEHLKGLARLDTLWLDGTPLTDAGLEHLKGLTTLSTLDLSNTKVTDAGLEHIQGMVGLKYLRLNHTQITGAGLEHLKGLQKLESLDLERSIQFTGVGLEHFKDLTGLWLNNTGVTDAGLEHFKGLTKLGILYLRNTPITGAGLKHLNGLTELSLLDLSRTKVTDLGLENLKGMTALRSLFLAKTPITDAGLQHLSGLSELADLDLSGTRITDTGLRHLKTLTGLKGLVLSETQVTDPGLENLKGLSRLRSLWLSNTRVTDAGLEPLKSLAGLEVVNLSGTQVTDAGVHQLKQSLPKLTVRWDEGLSGIEDAGQSVQSANPGTANGEKSEQPRFAARTFSAKTYFEVLVQRTSGSEPRSIGSTRWGTPLEVPACHMWWVQPWVPVKENDWDLLVREISEAKVPGLELNRTTDSEAKHLAGLTDLLWLWLQDAEVTDAGLESLKTLTGLKTLIFTDDGQVTDSGLAHLQGLTGLQTLHLTGPRVTDLGLASLQTLKALENLSLNNVQITDAGLVHLKGLTRLQVLDLSGTKVDGTGLAHLKDLPRLEFLNLAYTQLTDAGLANVKGLTGLKTLYLNGTDVTDAGVQQLKQSLPKLYVERGQTK